MDASFKEMFFQTYVFVVLRTGYK